MLHSLFLLRDRRFGTRLLLEPICRTNAGKDRIQVATVIQRCGSVAVEVRPDLVRAGQPDVQVI